jgi:hypothetical protein
MMDFDAFDDELLNPSPLRDTDLWLSSPPTAIATQLRNEQQSDDSIDDDSGDDDGLYGDASLDGLGDNCSEGSFGDEEHVVVAADQYSWKIDHSKGDHKFKGVLMCSGLRAYAGANSD